MARQVKPGAVLRRGASKLTADELLWLANHPDEVDKIIADIDARRKVYLDVVRKAESAGKKSAASESAAVKKLTEIATSQAALDDAAADHERKRFSGMEALNRRTREVMRREEAADGRDAGLKQREDEIETRGRNRETELAGREEIAEARESAADERDQAQQKQASDLNGRQKRLDTAVKMVKQAVAPLG